MSRRQPAAATRHAQARRHAAWRSACDQLDNGVELRISNRTGIGIVQHAQARTLVKQRYAVYVDHGDPWSKGWYRTIKKAGT